MSISFDQKIGSGGAVRAGLIAWALATFVASPAFFAWTWTGIMESSRAADFLRLCLDPLSRDLNEPIMAYRLTVPVLAWLLHLPPLLALALPYVAHGGFLATVLVALRQRTDPATAFLGTLVVALSFALFWSNWHPGFTDTTTHWLVASLLVSPALGWVFPATFLGLLNDERMLLALPFVLWWHFPTVRPVEGGKRLATGLGGGLAAGLALYLLVRHGLSAGWLGPGIQQPETYRAMIGQAGRFTPHLGSWWVWGANVFLSFRWAWLLIPVLIWWWCRQGSWLRATVFCGLLAGGVLASALVADVARSVGFLFPAWLLAIVTLHGAAAARLRDGLRWGLGALLVTPVFFTFEHFQVQWFRPLPLVLLRAFTGLDLVQWLR